MKSKFFQRLVLLGMVFAPLFSEAFIFYDWNLKHLGRERFSTKNVASVLADGDLIVIQEVNTTISGRTKLRELRDAILAIPGNEKKKLCMGISKKPSDGRERYAMLWNQAEMVQVDEKGKEIECKDNEFIELELTTDHKEDIVREPAYVLLMEKRSKRIFMAATIHALPKGNGKTPEKEIPLIFESVNSEVKRIRAGLAEVPKAEHAAPEKKERAVVLPLNIAILAGDFNLSVRNKPFEKAKELGFEPVLSSGPKSSLSKSERELANPYDNIFLKVVGKKVHVNNANVINLYKRFEKLEIDTIYNTISDHCPVRMDVDFDPK